jgi:hypothetical protein
VNPLLHVTIRWPAIAVLVALALLFLALVISITKALTVPRDHHPPEDVPETDYYTVDIDEAEKRARGERRE